MKIARTDRVNLIRDLENKALLNTDNDALFAYKKKKHEQQRIQQLEDDVKQMKTMLNAILDKLNGSSR